MKMMDRKDGTISVDIIRFEDGKIIPTNGKVKVSAKKIPKHCFKAVAYWDFDDKDDPLKIITFIAKLHNR